MLIFKRKVYDEIVIRNGQDEIIVKVTEIRTGTVRIGVEAPPSYLILRREIDGTPPKDSREKP